MNTNTLIQFLLGTLAIATLSACSSMPEICNVSLTQITDDVLTDVGQREAALEGDCFQRIIVFEERHDSLVGQIELATMLYRLYQNYGLRDLALEGVTLEQGAPDASWFHRFPDEMRRREVALQLLKEGEISAADFMVMVFEDFRIHPIERHAEYQVEMTDQASEAMIVYLIAIAEKSLSPEQLNHVNSLIEQGNEETAIDFMIDSNPWVKDRYDMLANPDLDLSVEELADVINELEAKAIEVGADVSGYEDGLQSAERFFTMASQRSKTMVESVVPLFNETGVPIALNIGAAHSEEIKRLLEDQSIAFTVVSPLSLVNPNQAGYLDYDAYNRKLDFNSVDPLGALGALLDKRPRKPGSSVNQDFLESKAAIMYITSVIADIAEENGEPSFDLAQYGIDSDGRLGPIQIDLSSIERIVNDDDGTYDAIFSVKDLNTQQTLWLRVGKVDSSIPDSDIQRLDEALGKLSDQVESDPDTLCEPITPGETPVCITNTTPDTRVGVSTKVDDVRKLNIRI